MRAPLVLASVIAVMAAGCGRRREGGGFSGTGFGSTFTVRFPAVPPPEAISVADVPERAQRPHKRVLLVDDHADSRDNYALLLRADGHEVCEAENGDVAIVDFGLPGADGFDVARRIRSQSEGSM